GLPTAWDLLVARWANAVLAAHALEARELERRHPGRRDAIPGCARDGDRRGSGAAGLAGAAPRRPRGPEVRRRLQLRLRARDDSAVVEPLAQRSRDPHLAGQHGHRVGADGAGDVAGLRALV